MELKRSFSGSPWEPKVGYCRAIKAGRHIYVSGTAPLDSRGEVYGPENHYEQTKRCLEIIQKALRELGGDLKNVMRTRMFVTDISKWQEYGRAHQEFFAENPPATTMVEVKALISPLMLIEVEVEALLIED